MREDKALVVAAALMDDLSRPRKLLGAARSYPERWRGYFEFPGGKTEKGESAEEALRRELREELGVEIELGELLPGQWEAHGGYRMKIFLCALAPGNVARPGSSHLRLEWVAVEEAQRLPWLPADYPMLEAREEYLGLEAATG